MPNTKIETFMNKKNNLKFNVLKLAKGEEEGQTGEKEEKGRGVR